MNKIIIGSLWGGLAMCTYFKDRKDGKQPSNWFFMAIICSTIWISAAA